MDVSAWLRELGLGQYEEAFSDNAIDGAVLPSLTADDLKELGVGPLGHRRRMLDAIATIRAGTSLPSAPPLETQSTPPPPASEPRDSAERRPITVMFCDLVGSTSMAANMDAEDWRDLVGVYLDEASKAVTQYGGYVLKKLGDGLMALFGYPKAQENDTERAARAGLAILRALEDLNAKNTARGLPALAARIGLQSGPVVVDSSGEVFGEAPNVAARVQAAAEPGTLFVTALVQRQLAGLFVAEDKGPHSLKGVLGKPVLYRLVRASGGGRKVGARSLTPLVGREEELATLTRRWERAKVGDGQFVQIVGEPGLGKSRLIEEFRIRLAETPHTWVEWSSSQLLQNTPLHPLAEWGRQRFAGEAKFAELEAALAQVNLDPAEYALLLASVLDIATPDGRAPQLAADELRRRQLVAMVTWILAGARAQPLVLAFEDLHWADPTTLDLMKTLSERGGQAVLLIVATARPEFRAPWATRSHHGVISLSPLDRAQIVEMVGVIAARHALSKNVVEGLSDRTAGVPLFIEELTRLMLEGGAQTVPPTLQQSLAARLDRLGEAREVAQIGAVLGREFSHALLAAVAEMPDSILEAALEKLADVDLLFVDGAAPAAIYRFKHALIQDAAYESLLKARRQALHRRAAAAIIEAGDALPELVAHHLTAAGQVDKASPFWLQAGRRAVGGSFDEEAIRHLTSGLDALATLPNSPERDRDELDFQIALGTPLAAQHGYGNDLVGAVRDRAIELCERLGETQRLLPTLYGQYAYCIASGKVLKALEYARRCQSVADRTGDRLARLIAHRAMGVSLLEIGEFEAARREFEHMPSIDDEELDQPLAITYVADPFVSGLAYLSLTLWALGFPEKAAAVRTKAKACAALANHANTSGVVGIYACAQLAALCGDLAEIEASINELNTTLGSRAPLWTTSCGQILKGWAIGQAGQTEAGIDFLKKGLTASKSQVWFHSSHYHTLLAILEAKAGDVQQGLRTISLARELISETGEALWLADVIRVEGELRLLAGAPEADLETIFSWSIEIAKKQGSKSLELRACTSLAKLWARQGKREQARNLLAPVYNWFTEGFATFDLKVANEVLTMLA